LTFTIVVVILEAEFVEFSQALLHLYIWSVCVRYKGFLKDASKLFSLYLLSQEVYKVLCTLIVAYASRLVHRAS